jgi:signal transduction histidine kinase/CheY-like chemotaxis protein
MERLMGDATARAEGATTMDIDGAPHLLHFKNLNPGSSFHPGVLVSLFPLADSVAHLQWVRWEIIGAGALLLCGGLVASHLLAARLSVPVEKLAIVSSTNAEQRDRAEAALEMTNEELRARNAELGSALAELKQTQQRVIRQERLRALGQMASGVAHDFNNALVPILGFSELLQLSPGILADREKALSYVGMIHTAAGDAAKVVSRLRQFYRKQEPGEAFGEVDVAKLVAQTITLTRPRWKEQAQAGGATIHVEPELGAVPPVLGDESELREVLTNLIFNAVDAMPAGGSITVRTKQEDGLAKIEVSDTGTGMTEEVRKRCLDPFFSTKGERGTGLGLSMVFGIVQRHAGTIDIRSELGVGTTFIVSLPLQGAQAGPENVAKNGARVPRSLSVLVVDDEQQVRDFISAALEADGHRVEMAKDGAAGLRCFRDGRFDMVVTDKAMPGMSGDQMASAMKLMKPGTPVILLTGFGQFLDKDELPGIDVLLSKPVGVEQLREALSSALSPV